nr:alpha/beta hydrolase [Marinicella sp. W31]MDC2878647.1 alpha/beta hydrolase [Marinicella sp. W31]
MQAAKTDPPYLLGPPTLGWLSACLGEIARATKPGSLARVACPALVLSGGRDSLIPLTAQRHVAAVLGADHLVLPEAGHEILQEVNTVRDRALEAIIGFFDEYAKPA